MPTRLILDCDPGTDDAVAIMLAALHPDLELVAVPTVNGHVPVSYCTDSALRVLDYIGQGSVPVYEGAASPLSRADFPIPRSEEVGHRAWHAPGPPFGVIDQAGRHRRGVPGAGLRAGARHGRQYRAGRRWPTDERRPGD